MKIWNKLFCFSAIKILPSVIIVLYLCWLQNKITLSNLKQYITETISDFPHMILFDLGLDDVYDEVAVNEKIMEIDEKFHLVMILEHFEV